MRVVNRLLSLLLGLALLGGGLLLAAEAALVEWDGRTRSLPTDDWYDALTTTRLGDDVVVWSAIGIALGALALLVAELRACPPRRLPLEEELGPGRWWVARRSAQRVLARHAEVAGDVHSARTRAALRRGRWRIRVRARARHAGTAPEVRAAVQAALDRLHVPEPVRVQVHLREQRKVG